MADHRAAENAEPAADVFRGGLVMKDTISGLYEVVGMMYDAVGHFAFYGVSSANWGGGIMYGYGPTTFSTGINLPLYDIDLWLRIYDDSTDLNYSVSLDGTYWFPLASISRTHYLTNWPNQCGLTINDNNGFVVNECAMDCVSLVIENQ